jgi:hypothetical protein
MATASNLTVKAADGTTDVVYAVQTGAAGDGSKARWGADPHAVGRRDLRPYFEMKSNPNGNLTARRSDLAFAWPVYSKDSSVTPPAYTLLGWNRFSGSYSILQASTDDDVNETIAESVHLMNHPDVVAALKTTYTPT